MFLLIVIRWENGRGFFILNAKPVLISAENDDVVAYSKGGNWQEVECHNLKQNHLLTRF